MTLTHTFHRVTATLAWAAVLAGASSGAWAAAVSLAGASANGSVQGSFIVGCTTCPHGEIMMSGTPDQNVGGPGSPTAAVLYQGIGLTQALTDDHVLGGATYRAMAGFEAAMATPVVRARASSDNEQVFRSGANGPVFVGIDSYQVSASATAIQRYTYLGSESSEYSFSFYLDGVLEGSVSSVGASAGIYAGNDPFLEVALAADGAFVQGSVNATTVFDRSFTLTVMFDPGQSYYLRASVGASQIGGYTSEDGSADAFNTFRVTDVRGNLNLLSAQIPGATTPPPGVPTPATIWLLLAAVALAGVQRCRLQRAL